MDNLAKPEGLSPVGTVAYEAIMAIVRKYDLTSDGCRTFYTPKEWFARGEKYGTRSELVIVYDGGDIGEVCRIDGSFYRELLENLKGQRLYVEECTGWYAAVYPC